MYLINGPRSESKSESNLSPRFNENKILSKDSINYYRLYLSGVGRIPILIFL